MSLQLVIGRAGTGKSEYCFNKIKENIDKESKIYVITPEQFSFTAEQNLLKILDRKSVVNAEVITFNRMAERIFTEVRWRRKCAFDKSAESLCLFIVC